MLSKKKIKKCPFCGGEAKLRKHNRTIIEMEKKRNCYVYCVECGARAERFVYEDFAGPRYFHDKAIEAWNERQQEANKWIPCSEQLPDEHDSMFAELKGTDKWNDAMFEKISDDVNVTVEYGSGKRKTMTLHTVDGNWKTDRIVNFKVIAWQPLPESYKEESQ